MKATESFSVSPTHSWLSGVVVMTPDMGISRLCVQIQEFVGVFGKKSLDLISLILNIKLEKTRIWNTTFVLENLKEKKSQRL